MPTRGVHADTAAKVKHSYEHMDPAQVGNRTRVLVSDMSGRSSIMMKAKEIGVDLDPRSPVMKEFLQELKALEYRGYGYEAADASFKLLLDRFLKQKKNDFELVGYRVMVSQQAGSEQTLSEATVQIKVDDQIQHTVAEANGPVAALDAALRKALRQHFRFKQWNWWTLMSVFWRDRMAQHRSSVCSLNRLTVSRFGALSAPAIILLQPHGRL